MNNNNTVPPNYTPLPAAPQQPGPGLHQTSHDKLRPGRVHGVLTLQLTAIDPVRVGTGGLFPVQVSGRQVLAGDLIMRKGGPLLPGSSLKGVARSAFEAIAGGCELNRPCNPPCVACQLFGFVQQREHFAGRVGIDDAQLLRGSMVKILCYNLPKAFAPRRMLGRRVYGRATPGALSSVPTLAAASGSVFETRVQMTNLSPGEAGLFALSLGLDGSFCPRVGGGKYHGFGRVRARLVGARLRPQGYAAPPQALGEEAAQEELQRWLNAAQLSPDGQAALNVLRATLGGP